MLRLKFFLIVSIFAVVSLTYGTFAVAADPASAPPVGGTGGTIVIFKVYSYVAEEITKVLKKVTGGAVGGTISLITGTVVIMMTIYYMVMGYQIMVGGVQNPLADFIKSGVKFILIATFALSADNYNNYVVSAFWDLQSGIASAWSSQNVSAYQYCDATMDLALNRATNFFSIDGLINSDTSFFDSLRYFVLSIFMIFAALVVTLPAAAMILLANATMILLLAVGPLFVVSLMFPVISNWFEKWFAQIMTQIFTIGFLTMIAVAGCRIVNTTLIKFSPTADSILVASFQVVAMGLVIMWLLYRASNLASALAGGVSSSAITFGAMAASAMGVGRTVARGVAGVGRGINRFDKGKTNDRGESIVGRKSARLARATGQRTVYAYQAGMRRWQNRNQGGSIKPV
jgi:type IV secretion system protein VirB6